MEGKTCASLSLFGDSISVKILKIAKPIVSKPITMLINKTIENASFPNKLKEAQVEI
jgi:hypothetical protein